MVVTETERSHGNFYTQCNYGNLSVRLSRTKGEKESEEDGMLVYLANIA